jgi:hypothetical protein
MFNNEKILGDHAGDASLTRITGMDPPYAGAWQG